MRYCTNSTDAKPPSQISLRRLFQKHRYLKKIGDIITTSISSHTKVLWCLDHLPLEGKVISEVRLLFNLILTLSLFGKLIIWLFSLPCISNVIHKQIEKLSFINGIEEWSKHSYQFRVAERWEGKVYEVTVLTASTVPIFYLTVKTAKVIESDVHMDRSPTQLQ